MPTLRPYLALTLSLLAGLPRCTPPEQPPPVQPTPTFSAPASVPAAPAPAPAPAAAPAPSEQSGSSRAAPDVPPPGSPLDRVMQAHFQDALLIRKAVIEGTPERASEPAQVFVDLGDLGSLPHGWQGFVERMQDAARRITNSTSSAQTAAATADLGVSCGMCHEEHGGPKPSNEPQPVTGTSLTSRMQRHVWATERLWEGLYVPSGDAWNAGAKALGTEPFPKELLKSGGVHLRSAASDFGKLAAKALTRKTVDERAALYAEMLVTCGACHQAVNVHE